MDASTHDRIALLEHQLAAERARADRLEAQLRNLGDSDPLTDLRNRRSLEQAIADHLTSCARYGAEGCFVVVGLDGMRDVAATLGVDAADDLLVALAEAVTARLRGTDVVGRWAADELAVLLPRADEREARVVADALLELVRTAGTAEVPVGCLVPSGGVSRVHADDDVDALVVRATLAMLASRRAGGDRWTAADDQLSRR